MKFRVPDTRPAVENDHGRFEECGLYLPDDMKFVQLHQKTKRSFSSREVALLIENERWDFVRAINTLLSVWPEGV